MSAFHAFGQLIPLEPPRIFEKQYCEECGEETPHVAPLECANGSIAYCSLCGEEKLISFSRTTVGEVA